MNISEPAQKAAAIIRPVYLRAHAEETIQTAIDESLAATKAELASVRAAYDDALASRTDYIERFHELERENTRLAGELAEAKAENDALSALYMELIMEVGNKHENETRHETALRYIRSAEVCGNVADSYEKDQP